MATSAPFGRPGPSALDEISIPSVASAPAAQHGDLARVIMRVAGRPFSRIQVVLAVLVELVGADNVAGAVGQGIDGNPFAVTTKAASREVREFAPASG